VKDFGADYIGVYEPCDEGDPCVPENPDPESCERGSCDTPPVTTTVASKTGTGQGIESDRDYVTLNGVYVLLNGERIWLGG